MSEQTPDRPSSIFLAILATVTYIACVISAWGVLSLLLDLDVISDPDAGTLVGPTMVASAAVVTFFSLRGLKTMGRPVTRAALAAAVAYLAMVAVVAVTTGTLAAEVATGPFAIAAGLLSAVTVLAVWRYEHPRHPRWRDPRY